MKLAIEQSASSIIESGLSVVDEPQMRRMNDVTDVRKESPINLQGKMVPWQTYTIKALEDQTKYLIREITTTSTCGGDFRHPAAPVGLQGASIFAASITLAHFRL